jgi:TIR domain
MSAGSKKRVFLCHAAEDKADVRKLYKRLRLSGFVPWLDEEDLVPGQEWQAAIQLALSDSAAVIVCLSSRAILKTGYVQKEIHYALERAEEMPEGRVYIIPVMLETCKIPERLSVIRP